jgi:hypothetical protein
MLDSSWCFDRFRDAIRDLPARIDRATLLSDTFRLISDQQLTIYYAPFDRVNTRARLANAGVDADGDWLSNRSPRTLGRF